MKISRLTLLLACILCMAQAQAALFRFDYTECRFAIQLRAQTLALGVIDMRDYVRSGKHPPQYIGIKRGGYGNPWNVETKSGNPLAEDMAGCLRSSFEKAGFTVAAPVISYNDDQEQAIGKLQKQPAARKMLLVVHEWRTDNIMSFASQWTDIYYNFDLIILDGTGRQIALQHAEAKAAATTKTAAVFRAHLKDIKHAGQTELVRILNELLAGGEIMAAFNGGETRSSGRDATTAGDAPTATPRTPDQTGRRAEPAPAGSGLQQGTADELAKYKKLLDDGAITPAEYQAIKDKILQR